MDDPPCNRFAAGSELFLSSREEETDTDCTRSRHDLRLVRKQVLDDRQETDPVDSDLSLQFPTTVANGRVCAHPMMARCTVTVFSRLLVLETNELSPHSAGMQNLAPPTS